MDEVKKSCASARTENSEFYRRALAGVTFLVSEVKEACRFLPDFAKISEFREITRLGIN